MITLFASRHLMVLLHEWTHSSAAWALGHKEHPFAIHYGDWTLLDVNEDVDYETLYAAGQGDRASLIAISALVTNLALFLLCIPLLSLEAIQQQKWVYQFVFWFAVMNVGELFSYVPVRTFVGNNGDVGHFVHGLGISPWVVFLPGISIVGIGLWHLLVREMPRFYRIMSLSAIAPQRIYLGLTIFVIFFWYGSSAFWYYGPGSARSLWTLAATLMGIVLFVVCNR